MFIILAERRALFRPGYKDDPSSDSLVSRDINSNTVRVKQKIQAIRRRRREPSNLLSLVRYRAPPRAIALITNTRSTIIYAMLSTCRVVCSSRVESIY